MYIAVCVSDDGSAVLPFFLCSFRDPCSGGGVALLLTSSGRGVQRTVALSTGLYVPDSAVQSMPFNVCSMMQLFVLMRLSCLSLSFYSLLMSVDVCYCVDVCCRLSKAGGTVVGAMPIPCSTIFCR